MAPYIGKVDAIRICPADPMGQARDDEQRLELHAERIHLGGSRSIRSATSSKHFGISIV